MTRLLKEQVRAYERRLMYEALRRTGGHQGKAAKVLGIGRKSFDVKLHRDRRLYPDPRWNDEPLAWTIRMIDGRAALRACWTSEDIAAEAVNPATIAVLRDTGARNVGGGKFRAEATIRDINTEIAIRASMAQRAAERA